MIVVLTVNQIISLTFPGAIKMAGRNFTGNCPKLFNSHLQNYWPGQSIAVIEVSSSSRFFSYPRGNSWSDYPVVKPISSKLGTKNEIGNDGWRMAIISDDGSFEHIEESLKREQAIKFLKEADDVVYLVFKPQDSAYGEYYETPVNPYVFLSNVMGEPYANEDRTVLLINRTDGISLYSGQADLSNHEVLSMNTGPYGKLLDYALVKNYFDYNYNVNSLAIIGETFRKTATKTKWPDIPFDKSTLQLLYFFRRKSSTDISNILDAIDCWPNETGRYDNKIIGLCFPGHRYVIISRLIENGLIAADRWGSEYDAGPCSITPKGEKFLEALHPDCEDPDQPFRLDAWCNEGLSTAKPKIDRYIRTFFGKQKRFLSHCGI